MAEIKNNPNVDLRSEVEVVLTFPVTVEARTYNSLTIRRPKTKDGILAGKFKGGDAERGVFLFARLCDVAPNVIEELDEVDTDKLGAQLNAFRGRQED